MKLEYKNTEKKRGILILEADVGFSPTGDLSEEKDLESMAVKRGLEKVYGKDALYFNSSGRENRFSLWLSEIKEWSNQKSVTTDYSIERQRTYEDKESGNLIGFFDFSRELFGKKQIKVSFSLETSEVELKADDWSTKDYDRSSPIYRKYTQSERQLSQTDDIRKAVEEIVHGQISHLAKAKLIYDWTRENTSLKNTDTERGAVKVFRSKDGNSREISFLYITLMRAAGIPARFVAGAFGEIEKKQEFHSWAEFYLEEVGWVPVDCAKGLFGKLDNKRIIFSKGENILLEKGPANSEVFGINYGRVFYLQPEAVYLDKKENGLFALKKSKYLIVKG